MSQLLLRPAPDDWPDGFQSLTRPPDARIKTESPLGLGGGLLMAAGAGVGLAALLRLVTWAVAGKWLPATLLGLGLTPLGYLALWQALRQAQGRLQGRLFRAYRQFNAGIKDSRGRGRAIVTTRRWLRLNPLLS